jgi:hypothetical protein
MASSTNDNDLEPVQNNKLDQWEEFFRWRGVTVRDFGDVLVGFVFEWVLMLIAVGVVAAIWYFIP